MSPIVRSRAVAIGAVTVAVVAVAGTTGAVAGSLVTSADIKDGTIKEADLHRNSVGSQEIINGDVARRDLSTAVKSDLKPGLAGYELVYTSNQVDGGTTEELFSSCNGNKVPISGAVDAHDDSIVEIYSTFDGDDGWTAQVANTETGDTLVTVVVACAQPLPQ